MRADLVLSGRLGHVAALVGVIEAFEDRGYEWFRVAGVGAGGILAALLAAGYRASQLGEITNDADWESLLQARPVLAEGYTPATNAAELLADQVLLGAVSAGPLDEWLDRWLYRRGVSTFADLQPENASGGRPRLTLFAADARTGRVVRLPDDLGLPTADSVRVVDAVGAAAAFPFVFGPRRIGDWLLSDASGWGPLPVDAFDRPVEPPRWPTFGVAVQYSASQDQQAETSDRAAALAGLAMQQDRVLLPHGGDLSRSVVVAAGPVHGFEAYLSPVTRDQLRIQGQVATLGFLDMWSFETYVRDFREPAPGAPVVRLEAADLTERDANAVLDALRRRSRRDPGQQVRVGFAGSRVLTSEELADAVARRTPDGERFLRMVRYGTEVMPLDQVLSRLDGESLGQPNA
jgi:NTE family protein